MLRWILVIFLVLSPFSCISNALAVDKSHLMAYWSCDKGAGQTVPDDSGNGHEGKIMAADWDKNGQNGSGMSFDGVGAFLDVPSDPSLDPQTDNWTIELWLKRADLAGGWQKILTKYPGNWTGYRIGLLDSSIHTIFGTGPAPNSVEFQTSTKIQDMQWHHLAAVYDRSGDAVIYLDGVADATTMNISKIGLVKVDNNVEIGRCHWCGGGKTMGFNGTLDEIKLWRAALTADEVELALNGKLLGTAVSVGKSLPITWEWIKKQQ
jgi:hypothetical protein